ncbi:MAG TPA: polyprenol phosphomannose-dependent alpha 1,6 mannosyltransferase MptB, partial [Solirubrobacterales bacterium]|nr:polyprenol phosphomannose-dependent alpha 1,6 mannosyltransferase MptB [Solirubrobacterales bacterium]
VYSYVDYARLGVLHGLDPYVHAPESVPADPAFSRVAWTEATSAYGPLFTLATYPLAWLPVDAAVYVLKAVSAAALLATAYLVARLAPARGIDPTRAATFVGLNPLVLVHVVGGPHNEGLAVLLMTLGVAGVLTSREGLGAGAFASACVTKSPAAIAIPFALLGTQRRVRFLLGAALAMVSLTLTAYLAFEWSWLHAFTLAGENQDRTSHLSIPITTARLTGLDPTLVRTAALTLYAVLVIYLLAWTHRGGDWLRATAWATTGLLLATAWLLPWYLLWPLPAAALSRDRLLQALLLVLTAYQLGARIPL